jgi:hypothetical protein
MICKKFQPRFVPAVKSGAKTTTIRPRPKRMPKIGEKIRLERWTGKPYRSKVEIIGESVIVGVGEIYLRDTLEGIAPPLKCEAEFLNAQAVADGFSDYADMQDWFRREHGLPFRGILIRWA